MKGVEMKSCSFCGNNNFKEVETEYTYKHDGKYLIVEKVPCEQCTFCGEQYFKADVLKRIENEFFSIHKGNKRVKKELIIPVENFKEVAI